MPNSCKPFVILVFTMTNATVIQTAIIGVQMENDYNRDNYQSNSDDKPDLQQKLNDFIKAQSSTNSFVKDTFMDLKTKLETITKNHQASIQNHEAKFDRFADKQSSRPSGSLPSNTQPIPKCSSSKPYQPPQAQNEHVNAVFTQSGKTCDPPINPNDQPNDSETPIKFNSGDEDDEPTPPTKPNEPKPSVRLADRSFQYPVGITENMLVEVVIQVKQKQLNLRIRTKRMIFHIDSAMKHYHSNDATCFSIDVIDKILEEDFDALFDEGSKILHSIE
nr:reverse transcriptase domain-containing protein [Tanacetum cinerariifolium]